MTVLPLAFGCYWHSPDRPYLPGPAARPSPLQKQCCRSPSAATGIRQIRVAARLRLLLAFAKSSVPRGANFWLALVLLVALAGQSASLLLPVVALDASAKGLKFGIDTSDVSLGEGCNLLKRVHALAMQHAF